MLQTEELSAYTFANKFIKQMFKQSLTLLLMGILWLQVTAQEIKQLALKDAIEAAVKSNATVNIAKMDERIAQARFKETDAIFLPQVAFSYTALTTNNPLNAFGFKLQQKSIAQSDFNPDLLNHPSGTPDFSTKLELQQPLINLDMAYLRTAAQKQTEIYQYKTQRTKEHITFEVKKAYLQLALAYKAVAVLEESLTTAKQVHQSAENYLKQGLVQKSDVLNAEVFVATVESNLTKAKSNIANASDYISLLMGQTGGMTYTVESNSTIEKVADSVHIVPALRSDFLAMQKALDASDLMIKSSKMNYLPKLNAFGSYQLNDASMFGFGANAYLAGVQLSWDIFKGNRTKNSIVTKNFERNKLAEELKQQKDQGQLELNKAFRDLHDAEANVKQSMAAVDQAGEALRILQNRYRQGLATTNDILLSTNQLSQQKLNYQQALFNVNVTQAYLQLLTTSNTK